MSERCKHCGREIEGAGGVRMSGRRDWWRHADNRARSCDPQASEVKHAEPRPPAATEEGERRDA